MYLTEDPVVAHVEEGKDTMLEVDFDRGGILSIARDCTKVNAEA